MDDKEMEGMLEKASLLPERWYLVFRQGNEDDHVMMTAYDTSTEDEDDEYIPAGAVILSGLVELMETDFERVMSAGLARLQFEATQEAMVAETGNGPDVPTPLGGCLDLLLTAGTTQGFYVTTTTGGIRYTTGAGFPVGSLYTANSDLEFYAGTGNVYQFGTFFGNATASRVWNGNINYTTGTSSNCSLQASKTTYGAGCYEAAASFYEVLTATGMDLGGMKVTGTATATGYDITTAPSGWTGPGLTATAMALGDDDFQDSASVGGTLGVWVGSNGNIALGGGNSTGFTPSVTTMLANPQTGIYAWTDLQPASGGGSNGDVFYEESGTVATVTYNGVDGWNTGDPNSIQFTYDTATGDFSILFGTVSNLNPCLLYTSDAADE